MKIQKEMIDTHKIYNALKANFSPDQADALTNVISDAILDFDRLVTKSELNELRETVKALAEAQKRTEGQLNALAEKVEVLAEAQRKTEDRLNALAEKVVVFTEKVEALAEAQRKTEEQVKALAEAQRKTEERIDGLSREMEEMRQEIRDIRQQLGGLSMALGYGIEDRVMPYFYDLAEKDYGITLKSVDRRNYVYPDGRYDEVNIYAEGIKDGKTCLIIAECKAQPGKRDVDRFSEMLYRLKSAIGLEIYPILIGYVFSSDVEMYVQKEHPEVRLMKTYEFEMEYESRKRKK